MLQTAVAGSCTTAASVDRCEDGKLAAARLWLASAHTRRALGATRNDVDLAASPDVGNRDRCRRERADAGVRRIVLARTVSLAPSRSGRAGQTVRACRGPG